MSKQLHKNFVDEQVKLLLKSYVDKEVKINYILSILGIKRSRFFELFSKYKKPFNLLAKGLSRSNWLSQQNDFQTFCMSNETEEVYHKLGEIINIF